MSVTATDGHCGTVVDIVVDPARRRLTHLVVQPSDRSHGPRLLPVDAVVGSAEGISLSCSSQDVLDAQILQETDFIELDTWPHQHDGWDVGIMNVLAWPHYPSFDPFDSPRWSEPGISGGTATTYDLIPTDTTELRRASAVLSSDGDIVGHVDGLVVDPDHGITHLVLDHGHLWGHREVTIPIGEVESVRTDVVHLRVSREVVGDFPSVRFHRHRSR